MAFYIDNDPTNNNPPAAKKLVLDDRDIIVSNPKENYSHLTTDYTQKKINVTVGGGNNQQMVAGCGIIVQSQQSWTYGSPFEGMGRVIVYNKKGEELYKIDPVNATTLPDGTDPEFGGEEFTPGMRDGLRFGEAVAVGNGILAIRVGGAHDSDNNGNLITLNFAAGANQAASENQGHIVFYRAADGRYIGHVDRHKSMNGLDNSRETGWSKQSKQLAITGGTYPGFSLCISSDHYMDSNYSTTGTASYGSNERPGRVYAHTSGQYNYNSGSIGSANNKWQTHLPSALNLTNAYADGQYPVGFFGMVDSLGDSAQWYSNPQFGESLAAGFGRVVIGAPGDGTNNFYYDGHGPGSAFLYSTSLNPLRKLANPDRNLSNNDGFGHHVAIGCGLVGVLAPWYNNNQGAAYIYGLEGQFQFKVEGMANMNPLTMSIANNQITIAGSGGSLGGHLRIFDLEGNLLDSIRGGAGWGYLFGRPSGWGKYMSSVDETIVVLDHGDENWGDDLIYQNVDSGAFYIYETPKRRSSVYDQSIRGV